MTGETSEWAMLVPDCIALLNANLVQKKTDPPCPHTQTLPPST
ncbi:MAG: hypothetical protein NWE92_11085 [Candidatus Bathyarchaeota archaeon]|nr:hypothetical protein [Candidatus Bathyarchaeota archaeon]